MDMTSTEHSGSLCVCRSAMMQIFAVCVRVMLDETQLDVSVQTDRYVVGAFPSS